MSPIEFGASTLYKHTHIQNELTRKAFTVPSNFCHFITKNSTIHNNTLAAPSSSSKNEFVFLSPSSIYYRHHLLIPYIRFINIYDFHCFCSRVFGMAAAAAALYIMRLFIIILCGSFIIHCCFGLCFYYFSCFFHILFL